MSTTTAPRTTKRKWGEWKELPTERAGGLASERDRQDLVNWHRNRIYSVRLFEGEAHFPTYEGDAELKTMQMLSIMRRDEKPVRKWGDLQRIKNEIMGPEYGAVEVYPPQHNLIDPANIYYLWILPPDFELPFFLRRS